MSDQDRLHRFIFEDFDLRGEIVSLETSYQHILMNHQYPPVINQLLGEFLAATSLLSSMLKFDGTITLQARGTGPLPLIMADCTRHKNIRAIAQLNDSDQQQAVDWERFSFLELLGNGTLSITIDPHKGERYQGIVPLESENLAGCLEDYFAQSEQLPTRLWLTANGAHAAGLLLQVLPAHKNTDVQQNNAYWDHICSLANTITAKEQLNLPHTELLQRLFHQETLRIFEPQNVIFSCSCSRERTSSALRSIGEQEVREILLEQGHIEVDCHFCHQVYNYTENDISQLFKPPSPPLH